MPHPQIRIRRAGPVATVLIDRAEKRNCLDLPMWEAMAEAFQALSAEESLGCVLLRGAGEAAFCAGADIADFTHDIADPARQARQSDALEATITAIRDCAHPVVAAVSGWCMGGGAALATACDFRVGGPGTRIGIPARRLGLWYPYAGLDLLLRLVGYPVACEIMLEGRVLGGEEAQALGLLTRCVPDAAVFEEATALAARITEGAPLANRFHKRALRELRGPLPVSPEARAAARGYARTEDFQGAVRAFLEKRPPVFSGR
ncbi:enoyl-CoA hydratase/isomerase family protein [Roseomonas sp. GC11]|uniref:enoyl-CoA hydratase/isomerase family protein n=1 Tax=Roseomonas sp. GC11 TaxID=2950546 RepID=UPI00210A0BD9|nr:enoyl-CoA hydratase/isomerase family protein [Roseomonas sp. GC11]MCQ4161427.1 enoyl-CoA hydratase/isomerase family protein [Roseomonas sp. GC11]